MRGTRVLVVAVLAVAAGYFLVPIYWLVVASTKSTDGLLGSSPLWFAEPRPWRNLMDLLTYDDGIYLRWLGNTVLYSGVGAFAATLLAAGAGHAMAKFDFRGREAAFKVVLGGVLVPTTVLALPLYLMFSRIGLANTYWSVLLPSVVSPFGVYLCRIYAEAAVPDELLEAARVDGAGELRIFFTIALRVMSPALVTVFLFQLIGIWNNFFLPLVMLSDPDLYPIPLGLLSWQSIVDRQPVLYQLAIGGALVSVVPLAIAIVVLQRFWRTGLTEGSVKA
ncbi:carbohydrate ABC transporter permease [Actinomadura sp. KC06]|uniref:carbohydrate ABC transporter permease n=1 Tax=Actinomadura sp. KC06 TaxID=2530369 RepID=UPI0010444F37|nr:carbohydrate ABC transporter permease [Actinomadura sp. KC06]TDD31644.1 carbohydrate ABC transporter permease [Actinomadura sp. KC06]